MPTIFSGNESSVLINGEAVEGVNAIEYRYNQVRHNVYGLGSAERIGMVSGQRSVEGKISASSTVTALDGLLGDEPFQISTQLRHGQTLMTVAFDDCHLVDKQFALNVGEYGQSIYRFIATRVREEIG
jgi:hypothetical protein